MEDFLDNSEAYWVLNKTNKKLLSMFLSKFEQPILNDNFEALQREIFFNPLEILDGKSINDLCVNHPNEVGRGLQKEESEYKHVKGSLIEALTWGDKTKQQVYIDMGLGEWSLFANFDFNFTSTIRAAGELNANQTVKFLLDKINELNSIEYQDMFMFDLARNL